MFRHEILGVVRLCAWWMSVKSVWSSYWMTMYSKTKLVNK